VEDATTLDDEGVVPGGLEGLWQTLVDAARVVQHAVGLAVQGPLGAYDRHAERRRDRLMAEADAEQGSAEGALDGETRERQAQTGLRR
jgi:hypothetical protein